MLQHSDGFTGSRPQYVPSSRGARGIYRSSYVRPTGGYRAPLRPRGGYRPPLRPVVPAGSGPGGAGLLAAILGPIGGLTGCLCCLNTIGIWGLFITAIPLTVFISKWLQAFKSRNGQNGAEELVAPHMLLLIVLQKNMTTTMTTTTTTTTILIHV
ncbi:unnamed protein product [Rotaria socialis]|uniref:Uncharacterized protein n=1 Tax=Rotaria socialis TaxID=392032 RepID=A0A819B270_9BILA|nr:unnamed protein product [Rotaria socialis]